MSARAPTPDKRPPEQLAVYLTPAQCVILEFLGEEYAGEVHPVTDSDLQEALDEAEVRGSVTRATDQLVEWHLLRTSRTPVEGGGRTTRYMLTERGKDLVLEYDDLSEEAKPLPEWTDEELRRAPISTDEKIAMLVDEIGRLREELNEGG